MILLLLCSIGILLILTVSLVVRVSNNYRNFRIIQPEEDFGLIDDEILENFSVENKQLNSFSQETDSKLQVTNEMINESKQTIDRISEEPFKWPLHESTLVDVNKKVTKMMSSNPTSVIRVEMVEKLKNLGIYRENTDCQLETNIRELARKTGLGLRRKSIRMSFDTFMSKSRPGLEDDGQVEDICENIIMDSKQVSDKIKEKQFGNVRKRNNSWSENKRNNFTREKRNSSNEATEKRNNAKEMKNASNDTTEWKYYTNYTREKRKDSKGHVEIGQNCDQQTGKKSSYIQAKDKRKSSIEAGDKRTNNFTNQEIKRKFSTGTRKIVLKKSLTV